MISVLFIVVCLISCVWAESEKFYALVIDAGSTGSRAFIFEFGLNEHGVRTVSSTKGKEVTPGLSYFADSPEDSVQYLLPTILDAASSIPKDRQMSTNVYIKGTAGMRLLPIDQQTKIWDALYNGLDDSPQMPFVVQRENFGSIDGYFEAYYAVLASNFVAGSINGNLRRIKGTEMVGALDMGGSSTQLIFHTGTEPGKPVRESDFWSHSWLNFGVEKVREKVWKHLVKQHGEGKGVVENPCTFVGYEEKFDGQYVLKGTGQAEKCVEVIKQVLWPEGHCGSVPCYIDGIEHPPLQGEFYAMSVYFYALDCIRMHGEVDLPMWPTPSIDEVEHAVHQFCALDWPHAEKTMLAVDKKHPYTKDEQLSHRCLEGLYMATLLEHGFGFSGARRDITLALEVRGSEVEWTLGYALAEVPFPAPLDSDIYRHEVDEPVTRTLPPTATPPTVGKSTYPTAAEKVEKKVGKKEAKKVETKPSAESAKAASTDVSPARENINALGNAISGLVPAAAKENASALGRAVGGLFGAVIRHFQPLFNVVYCVALIWAYVTF